MLVFTQQIEEGEQIIMNMYYHKDNDSYTTENSEKPDENALAYAV